MAKPDPKTPERRRLFTVLCEGKGWRNPDQTWAVTSVAQAIGKPISKASDLLNGRGSFGASIAREIEVALDLPPFYLDGSSDDPDFEEVNRLDIALAAGDGHVSGFDEVIGSLKFKRSFLRACGVKPDQAKVVDVKGHSMHPTIPDGAVVLIDLSRKEPVEGKIYALARPAEGIVIKRLKKLDGLWMATSDNPSNAPFPIHDGEPVTVIGRAVWFGATL
jgi:phage repressor protein C with HTH and peptisase S24 domain